MVEETKNLRGPLHLKNMNKQKKLRTDDLVPEDTHLVLTAAERNKVILYGEEPSLEEAARDKKKFMQFFGHIFPFRVDAIFHINIKK